MKKKTVVGLLFVSLLMFVATFAGATSTTHSPPILTVQNIVQPALQFDTVGQNAKFYGTMASYTENSRLPVSPSPATAYAATTTTASANLLGAATVLSIPYVTNSPGMPAAQFATAPDYVPRC